MTLDGRRNHQFPGCIDLLSDAPCESIDSERIKSWQFGKDGNQRTPRALCQALLVPGPTGLGPFVETAQPGLGGPLGCVHLRGATWNGDWIPAHDARQIAQGRCKNSEPLAPVDVTRAPSDRRK